MWMQHREDKQLIKRVLSKDRAAFETFFDTYFARLCRFARARMQDETAIEDVVQETMIKALRSLASYRGEAQLFTWLCQICRNEISNWYARHGKKQERLVSLDDDPNVRAILESLDAGGDPQEGFAVARVVQLTLDYLPDKYAKVLELKYVEGLSVTEIGVRLGTGRLATQSLLARARTAFRNAFRELGHELASS
jgi:RNA polymerase sigma-70 factor (ECF subfamily)